MLHQQVWTKRCDKESCDDNHYDDYSNKSDDDNDDNNDNNGDDNDNNDVNDNNDNDNNDVDDNDILKEYLTCLDLPLAARGTDVSSAQNNAIVQNSEMRNCYI